LADAANPRRISLTPEFVQQYGHLAMQPGK